MKTMITILACCAAIPFTGCDVKDPVYNTAHPSHGTVTLTTDWSRIGEGLQAPESYKVCIGDYTTTVSGTTNLLDRLFDTGKYSIYTYNTAEHTTVSGTTASVETTTAPAGAAGTFVHNSPGWLFTAAQDVAIEKDTDNEFTAVMQQQVRELTLVIEPTGGTTDRIERIEGTLSGVAGSFDMADGTHAAPSNVAMTFTKITSGADAGKWSATVRLLGTAGTEQKLHAEIAFTDNTPVPVPIDSDLTTALATFNADKRAPLSLGGKVDTPTESGFTATITDWTVVNRGPVVAE